jgi:hypothetical protein
MNNLEYDRDDAGGRASESKLELAPFQLGGDGGGIGYRKCPLEDSISNKALLYNKDMHRCGEVVLEAGELNLKSPLLALETD